MPPEQAVATCSQSRGCFRNSGRRSFRRDLSSLHLVMEERAAIVVLLLCCVKESSRKCRASVLIQAPQQNPVFHCSLRWLAFTFHRIPLLVLLRTWWILHRFILLGKLARLKQAKDETEKEIAEHRAQLGYEFQKKVSESTGGSDANVKRLARN
ncbi:hypothetical protein PIB30_064609 [Stylosanthes scabra]|uniref:V-type proton ATPase subunit G n=1 Tax=Stylosanthes scabra TaxID=79078 RepID=A0ABU6RM25_9FABA|nr:hypothetical protein [Stylosanthes scabra]